MLLLLEWNGLKVWRMWRARRGEKMVCHQCGAQYGEGALGCASCGPTRFGKGKAAASRPTIVQVNPRIPAMVPRPVLPGRRIADLFSAIFLLAVVAAIILPMFMVGSRDNIARRSSCSNNLKQLGTALLSYSQDYEGLAALPESRNWSDALYPYIKSWGVFTCPSVPAKHDNGPNHTSDYRYNTRLSGGRRPVADQQPEIVVFYDALNSKWNGYGGPELLDPRHDGFPNIAFMDGHVKWAKDLGALQWDLPLSRPYGRG